MLDERRNGAVLGSPLYLALRFARPYADEVAQGAKQLSSFQLPASSSERDEVYSPTRTPNQNPGEFLERSSGCRPHRAFTLSLGLRWDPHFFISSVASSARQLRVAENAPRKQEPLDRVGIIELASAHAAGSLAGFDHAPAPFIDADMRDQGSACVA